MLGYFMMIGGNGVCQLHIENIPGCEAFKHEEAAYGVTGIFVSKAVSSKSMRVVGFYKDAIAYRFPPTTVRNICLRPERRTAFFCHIRNVSAVRSGMCRPAHQSMQSLGLADHMYGSPVQKVPQRKNATT